MHKRAFLCLKRMFMHVQVFPHHILKKKTITYKLLFFKSNYNGGRPETRINVRFRACNARSCMSQYFPHHILIKNQLLYKLIF